VPDSGQPRILHVVSSDRLAGIERHVLQLTQALASLDYEVGLACRHTEGVVAAEARQHGVRVTTYGGAGHFRPDIVHVHDGHSAVIGLALAVRSQSALIRTQHFLRPASSFKTGWRRSLFTLLHRSLNRRVDGFIAISEAVAEAAEGRGETGSAIVDVIPPGIIIPDDGVVVTAVQERARVGEPTFASAGRLEPERQFDLLLDALPYVLDALPNAQLLISGSGSAEPQLRDQVNRLGLQANVTWTGWLQGLGSVFSRSHAYVNTLSWEGFGMATAEAMAHALPVVAIDQGGSRGLITPGVNGYLVPDRDPRALAGAITLVLRDREHGAALGRNGRIRARESFSVQDVARRTLDLYERVHERRGR
jgi:glycosyltransferase involved in cell wall biosynthesis